MSLSGQALQRVDNHWAVLAIGEDNRARGLQIADARLVNKAVGKQIFVRLEENAQDSDLLRRLALAYEMAAIEGLKDFLNPTGNADLREQCIAGAWRAFEIARLSPFPEKVDERIFHILHLSSLAYCGDRWSDLRRWYAENEDFMRVPSVADVPWQQRLLYRLFECCICLFRKKSWDDLDRIREIIGGLRADQKAYESELFKQQTSTDQAIALKLVSLYHWAKSTELLAQFMLQGEPPAITTLLDKHFESAIVAATASGDSRLEVLLRWMHAAARQMVGGSVWWVARSINSRVTKFVKSTTKHQAMFELLPPQRAALQEQGLLDQAATAVVVDMPTSGGKTLLAQFRILQALNQFDADKGWVAYVVPTRALSAQITRRLRRDFEPIGVKVAQLTGAVEIDAFEDDLLTKAADKSVFDVLVATPEKLQLVIRNKKVPRPLVLLVMDEAHNLQDETRGLRIELLLATVKRECSLANFLLLMPYVERPEVIARWLAHDVNAGKAISLGTTPWRPNERIVGMYKVQQDDSVRGGWQLVYQTLVTSPKTIHLEGAHNAGPVKPLNVERAKLLNLTSGEQKGLALQTAAMAKIMSERGTSIAVADKIMTVWIMARELFKVSEVLSPIPEEIRLVQKFLKTEISEDFELIGMLERGIGVHHAGLSDEVRALIEWLAEEGKLRVLCATSTIAQGINFPVSSVFLSSRFVKQKHCSREMFPRDFWNLAGRAGRMNHDSVGVVGLAEGKDALKVADYVCRSTGELVSRLVNMLDELETQGKLNDLETVIHGEQWDDFRCYVAHLWNEKNDLELVLADTEQLLRNTLGYTALRASANGRDKADKLLEVTKRYARSLSENPGFVALADMTGFSPEGVKKALVGMNQLERKLQANDWTPESLFGAGSGIEDLFGVMLKVPQIAESLEELGGEGSSRKYLADITRAWVAGKSIQEIAQAYFQGDSADKTKAITNACKAIYRTLVNSGTWGLSALSRLSGVDFDSLSDVERRKVNALPAMIYHGVKTEEAVLMRMNVVPRSVAERLGEEFRSSCGDRFSDMSINDAQTFLKALNISDWDRVRPPNAHLSGAEYKNVWEVLSGEQR